MSLPDGYQAVNYIEGDNAYIDTGYKPNNNTRLEVMYYAYGSASSIACCDTAWMNNGFGIIQQAAEYGSSAARQLGMITNTLVKASLENGIFTRNGTTWNIAASTFQTAYNMYLFATNRAGKAIEIASKLRIYECRLYENNNAVRDFIPCKNPSGEAGMWDDINGGFYGNIGTGSFTPGAVLITTPNPPENLTAHSFAGTNTLTWDESANAEGYRIYENGVLIGDLTGTTLTAESEPYSINTYSVTAYNDTGESDAVSIRVYTSGGRDVLDDLITDRTLADVTGRTKKGVYNASDVNRVCDAARRVKMLLSPLGYSTADVPDYRWSANEIPTAEEMAAYYRSAAGQDVLNYAAAKEKLPGSVKNLDYAGANAIEMMLRLTGRAAERIPEGYIYSGEIYGGDNF